MNEIPIYTDSLFLEHDTGPGHPEKPARLEKSLAALKSARSLSGRLQWTTGRPATRTEILRCHKPGLFELVEKTRGLKGRIDTDTVHSEKSADAALLDVVLMRQDPPFDIGYLTGTWLLERLKGETLVVNDPVSVRNAPEKVYVLDFARFMPPTLITRRIEEVQRLDHHRAVFGDKAAHPG